MIFSCLEFVSSSPIYILFKRLFSEKALTTILLIWANKRFSCLLDLKHIFKASNLVKKYTISSRLINQAIAFGCNF